MGVPFIDTLLDVVRGPLDKLIPDKNQKMQLEHEVTMAVLGSGLSQMEVNRQEAAHRSVFVAGWRPAVGWVCAMSLAWHFVLYDLAVWLQLVFFPHSPALPSLSGTGELVTVLFSMLGLGGLRSIEKLKGVSR